MAGNPDRVFVSASEFVRAGRPLGSARLGVAAWPQRPRAGHCRPEVEDRSRSPLDRLHVPVPFPGWAASRPTRSRCLRPLPAGQPDLAPSSRAAVPVCPRNPGFRPRTLAQKSRGNRACSSTQPRHTSFLGLRPPPSHPKHSVPSVPWQPAGDTHTSVRMPLWP